VPVDVSGAAAGSLTTTVSVASATSDPNGTNDSAPLTTTVSASADLDVTGSSDAPDPVVAGATLTYTVVADNATGPSDAQSVVVTHTLDADVAVQAALASGAGCTGAGGTWDETAPAAPTCTFTTIVQGANETYAVPVDVAPGATGSLTTTVSVAAATTDPNGANDSAALGTTVSTSADLDVTGSSHAPDPVAPLGVLTYTVVADNTTGPSDAQSVVVTHTLDADVAVQAALASGAGCTGAGGTWDETTPTAPTCTFATIAQGANETYAVPVDVSGAAVGSLSTTVSVASATADPNGANDSQVLATSVTFVPLPEVIVSVEPDAVGWTVAPEAGLYNLYRGNLEALKSAGLYTQDPGSEPTAERMCNLAANSESDIYTPPLGEVVFYLVSSDNGLVEGTLGRNSAGVERTNDNPCP
jgi:uncharacterized repeat protein (TIGR01451 family)